ncbi:MAG TPA: Flp pilus assembly protein CpaB [Kofleriaceae bacterium]|nr:Flp pilus assembly protein CpaB [Kofleriaceae bacterium]
MNSKPFVAALLLALGGAALLWVYRQRFEAEMSGGPKVPVLVATGDIGLGERIRPEHLGVRGIPVSYLDERAVRASAAQKVVGLRVRSRIKANESIMWSDLSAAGRDSRDLAGLVQPGMRAVSVPATVASAFQGLLRPGDRVDLLLTTSRPGGTDRPGARDRVTFSLLQNVLVLAVGDDLGVNEQSNQRQGLTTTVSVGVSAEQAQKLAFALDRGPLTLSLRNPEDIETLEGLPETEADDILRPAGQGTRIRQSSGESATQRGETSTAVPGEKPIERLEHAR